MLYSAGFNRRKRETQQQEIEGLDSNDTAPLFEIPVVQQEGEAGDRGGSVRNRQPYTICKY